LEDVAHAPHCDASCVRFSAPEQEVSLNKNRQPNNLKRTMKRILVHVLLITIVAFVYCELHAADDTPFKTAAKKVLETVKEYSDKIEQKAEEIRLLALEKTKWLFNPQNETLEGWIDVLGPRVLIRSNLDIPNLDDFVLIEGVLEHGAVVPLHSHKDRELFQIHSGELEIYIKDKWITVRAGELIDVTDGVLHGWRNRSGHTTKLMFITTVRIGKFFKEIGRPMSQSTVQMTAEDMKSLFEAATRYGYHLATPEENAQAGLNLPPLA
jgi:quercetin dioxygenase-like cupin family protein